MTARSSASAQLGRWAEEQAAAFLEGQGYRVVARNYRTRIAEADLVVTDGKTVVFVEVKGRRHRRFGTPWDAVDGRKRRRIVAAARAFLAQHPRYRNMTVRFDAVALEPAPGGGRWRIQWLPDAFSPHDLY